MLDKTYDPKEIEARRYPEWEKAGAFRAHPESNKAPYCIVIPPPNVTGSLHMGHALDNTLQDVLVRWRRMKGDDVLWQPGTDHAGIATQMVVVRNLEQEGIGLAVEGAVKTDANKKLLNREEFLAKVWEWKAYSGGTITGQLRRLGASLDWSRERFTMDEGLSTAVLKVFVELYKAGLIYKDNRLVNWDPKMLTAISDLEVESREVRGHLWYFKYPIEGSDEHIVVATTRPETMLGDTGVAVHPDDPKWKHLIGKHAILPLVGRRIPIVPDDYSDPEKGSGAVKITPAHDFNDFEVGRRHGLEAISIFDKFARLNDKVPRKYRGLDRFDARKQIVAEMEEAGLVEKIEPHTHAVPYGDRGGVPVEPFLTEQWYADAKKLAQEPIAAARDGRVTFVPERGREEFFRWMENIEPWCVSRQLWWGHQIPAWYGPDKKVFVALSEAEAMAEARAHYGKEVALQRDPDVLDTWFSSALWPFSTLGWPEQTAELAKYYPTSTLVTGWDILFFWVARHDDDGHAFHEGRALPHRLPARAGDGREGTEDVQVQGQYRRSPGADRQIRRRCAALHHDLDGGLGGGPVEALDAARRGFSQLRHQVLERHALRRDEWRGLAHGFQSGHGAAYGQQVGAGRTGARQRGHRQGDRRVPPQRGGRRAL